MSQNNVAVAVNTIQTVVNTDTDTVRLITTVHEPVISAAQGPQGIPGASTVAELTDIDKTNLQDGSLLVYSTQTAKWKTTIVLDKQALECGQY